MTIRDNPYLQLPATSRWKDVVAGRAAADIDPTLPGRFRITSETRIASAGSCFAQHVSENLRKNFLNYMITERGPEFLSDDERRNLGYGIYSARYGNIYTAAQLLQLFRWAHGEFVPDEPFWRLPDGGVVDPLRPGIQSGGFESEAECLWDRSRHIDAVRQLFAELDTFIFTLGLTEAWHCTADGAVLPVVPGSGLGGTYDPARYEFKNYTVAEVVRDLSRFIASLKQVNASAKVILTVSPVPLIATFENTHVLQSNMYSKSVLRAAAGEIVRQNPDVDYFPSFEIVSSGNVSEYLESDRRTVRPQAVQHVMSCFWHQFLMAEEPHAAKAFTPRTSPPYDRSRLMCDEDAVLVALADDIQNGKP